MRLIKVDEVGVPTKKQNVRHTSSVCRRSSYSDHRQTKGTSD